MNKIFSVMIFMMVSCFAIDAMGMKLFNRKTNKVEEVPDEAAQTLLTNGDDQYIASRDGQFNIIQNTGLPGTVGAEHFQELYDQGIVTPEDPEASAERYLQTILIKL